MRVKRTPLFEEIRAKLKAGEPDDRLSLMIWLLVYYTDDGHVRSPQRTERKTIVIDGVSYWLVCKPA